MLGRRYRFVNRKLLRLLLLDAIVAALAVISNHGKTNHPKRGHLIPNIPSPLRTKGALPPAARPTTGLAAAAVSTLSKMIYGKYWKMENCP